MAIKQGGTGARAKSTSQKYLADFVNETDPIGTPQPVIAKNRKLRTDAAKKLASIEEAEVQRSSRQQERVERKQEAQNVQLAGALSESASNVGASAENAARGVVNFAEGLPVFGGIGMVLLALVFFIWAVVPVGPNGETRMQLLYLTLRGQTKIQGEPDYWQSLSTTPASQVLNSNFGTGFPSATTSMGSLNGTSVSVDPNGGTITPNFGLQ